MNKTQIKIGLYTSFLLILTLCLFCSCGLETYVVMEAPERVVHTPSITNKSPDANYFEFWTKENGEYPSDFKFLGTDVYYKIYSNSSTMSLETESLNSLASNSTSNVNSASRMIETYGYKSLVSTNYHDSPLIKAANSNRRVYIRLTDYFDIYAAEITVDKAYLGGASKKTIPVRNISDNTTFNFGKDNKKYLPLSGDADVKYTTVDEGEEGTWYVAMYAVAVGRDATYANYYSNILSLGAVAIDENSENN